VSDLAAALSRHRLEVLGGFHPEAGEAGLPAGTRTLLLIGPAEPGFWAHVRSAADWSQPDPIDDWSRQVIGRLACDHHAKALFPFGGPPWHPFFTWALRSGRVWESPVKLLVHAEQGLMVSFRGALALKERVDVPVAVAKPCETCARPCLTACPADALTGAGYDVPACHGFLDRAEGNDCLSGGCLVRRACPVSQAYARLPEQSAYHMSRFHKAGKTV
jgi:hypothetical protein